MCSVRSWTGHGDDTDGMNTFHRLAIGAALLAVAMPVAAKAQAGATFDVAATTDERRRGLGWSDGDASVSAGVGSRLAGLDVRARVTALRGSARHGGADAVADLTIGTGWDLAGLTLRAGATGHLFAGARGGLDYGEINGDASYSLGPVQVEAGVRFAPSQRAIGGSNLYAFAGANAGIPATPWTVFASVGRSMGSDDRLRSDRLRPGGDYTDWRIGVDHVAGPITVGVDYTGTDLSDGAVDPIGDRRNSGDRVLARVRFDF